MLRINAKRIVYFDTLYQRFKCKKNKILKYNILLVNQSNFKYKKKNSFHDYKEHNLEYFAHES